MSELANVLLASRAIITDSDRILLVRRTDADPYNAGLWEFPGGKVDIGEEVEAGLAREVLEETALTVEVPTIAHVENECITEGKYAGKLYVALFYVVQKLGGELTISDEHSDAVWEDPEVAATYALTAESRRALSALTTIIKKSDQ